MNKVEIRKTFREKRKQIEKARRLDAAKKVVDDLYPQLVHFKYILSFASKGSEIDLWKLNEKLASEKRLCLPRLENDELHIFAVNDCSKLILSSWHIKEPDPEICQRIEPGKLDCILVPGLVFDEAGHRIGYGLGHYDRFLMTTQAPTIGVGFSEQKCTEALPSETHDKALDRVVFY